MRGFSWLIGEFAGLATGLGLLLQDMPGQQLALCVGQRFELRADVVAAFGQRLTVRDPCP
ncbi:hypothetical protein D3C77_698870 [compost metagenome]